MHSPAEAAAPLPNTNGTFCPQAQRRFVLIAAILASALGFIDGSILAIAMPAIRVDLGASLAQAQWISNAYALTLSALILAGGAAGDRFGLRRAFVAGIALFIAASLACALAPNATVLIAFRAIQGIGAAIMVPGSLAIIAKAYPKKERGRAIGIWAAASALTTALGPVLGGLVLSAFSDGIWRAIFAVNLPLGLLSIYLLLIKIPADAPTDHRSLDLGGAGLATLAFGALAYGLTSMSASGERHMAGPSIAAGLVLLVAFILFERRQREPMIDLSLFRIRAFAGANLATFFLYFALSANLFYLPMLLIAGWGLSTAEVGFIFLPLSASIGLLSGLVGRWSDRIGPRFPIAAGSLVVAFAFAGLALLAHAGIHHFWTGTFPLMALMGLGMALVVSPLSTAVMTSVEDNDTGAASGINNAVSRIGGLVAVAAMGSLAAWVYSTVLDTSVRPGIPGFGEPVSTGLPPELEATRLAASDAAFSVLSLTTALLCLLAAIIAWMTVSGQKLPWARQADNRPT
ncbi:DHA2 family efflux MFS transporter permease subunit [Mesorhizobium sp. M00.F.Ca.ET.186.01.1.1]|nr:DHA2 family efflux MFS transporter permease subunit [bacterium M00.F.Ca.ET.205.01.1.1]TGU56004.1 DHA2 family efflux MFS transporter permease subunit [bacterium M00.F.Ca.ET.152.01.1.1]TGV40548.1 DHA2 family efflux MFS transporter permease subunit [Mesorhizobium sp. M00.F.Ca.ET.186.01.1.1]TGZ45548.1 DHA2 family efflux MFS transporter permease subunit [bacterium M00.F.Ca.ET.162.01.1.1]TIW60703.1 MAG: MFS transporter [Mesorhizobium sp.]